MFFIGGVSSKQEKLDFNQKIICSRCGRYGSLEVYMEYMYLSLFFIPVYKWNKRYFVRSTCCNSTYSINSELGSRIEKGEEITLTEFDLQLLPGQDYAVYRCPNCGCELDKEFKFCPNCGKQL